MSDKAKTVEFHGGLSNTTFFYFPVALQYIVSVHFQIWSYECHGNVYSSPVTCHVFDVTLVLFGCHDGHIYCLQPESTVKLKWKQRLNSPVFSKPVLIRQGSDWVVSAATTKGSVFLCDVASGSVQTYLQLEGEVFSSPVVHDGRLYVGCRDNNLYCLGIGC